MTDLLVVGANPPAYALPESQTLSGVIRRLEWVIKAYGDKAKTTDALIELRESVQLLEDLRAQAVRGIHRNPRRRVKLARKMLFFDYVHAEDGKKYTHDFAEDRHRIEAFIEDNGRRVVLEAVGGGPVAKQFA